MPAFRRARWLGVVLTLVLALLVVDGVLFGIYHSYRQRLEDELGQRLVAVASGAAAAVNGDVWTRLVAGDSLTVAAARADLSELRQVNGVSTIFLYDRDERTLLDLGGQYAIGEANPALLVDLEAVTTARAGLPVATRLYSSRGGYLKSAYAPVEDADRNIVGGVGVEASATFFGALETVKRTLSGAALLVSLALILIGVLFARLLTVREALESRLRRAETLASMGQMTAMLAHEIRNPLGIIRGAAERVGRRHGLEEDEVFRFIPEEVDRLEKTLNAYLDFARPKSGAEVEDVRRALEGALEFMKVELEQKGIGVDIQLEPGEFPVKRDAELLRQAFLNVFLNARDAMASGGRLRVTLHRRGARAVVTIADTGSGMTEAVRRRATEPFFTDKDKGSGLGLAVVRRAIEDVEGKLELQSRPGHGTTVILTLPLASSPGTRPGSFPEGGTVAKEGTS